MWQQRARIWMQEAAKNALTLLIFVGALAVAAAVVNGIERLMQQPEDRIVIVWGVQVVVAVIAACGVVVLVDGVLRGRWTVPLWLFAVLLGALGALLTIDWRPRADATARYSFLSAADASLWRTDTWTGAVDLCALPKEGGFTCVRVYQGATASR